MKKLSLALLCSLLSVNSAGHAANYEPDESGIGGTGNSTSTAVDETIFRGPDIPERLELPDPIMAPPVVPESLPAGVGGTADMGGPIIPATDTATTPK